MPGLLTLQTDLKSLKYGQDRPNGGSSGQPYIQTDIRTVDATFSGTNLTLYDDGLIRGGMVYSQYASFIDTKRIAKFLVDPPKGPLFIAKQVGLQLSNPQLERKGNTTERYVGSTRLYNLGINTLAQVPLNALGEHIVRHGLLPITDRDEYYEAVVTDNNFKNDGKENRLVKLLDKIIGNPSELIISKYVGGPGSVYGIGNTLIRRAETPGYKGIILDYSNESAGQPLVNGKREAFTYIDPNTYNGGVSSDLGQRNKFSQWNKTYYIGGTAYLNKGLKDVFYDTITDPNALAKGVDQSVYNPGYIIPSSSIFAGNSRKTGSPEVVKITGTVDYKISEKTGSIFNGDKKFNLIDFGGSNNTTINDNSPLFFFTGSNNDKSQSFAGISRETKDTLKISSTVDYGLSNKSESLLSDRDFTDLPRQIIPSDPLSFYYAKSTDKGAYSRKSGLPDVDNKNDTTSKGPSSYPDTDIDSLKSRLDLPQTTITYNSPSVKNYITLKKEIDKSINKNVKKNGGSLLNHTPVGNYKYNTGTKIIFNRKSDRNIAKDTLALNFKAIRAFTGDEEEIKFLAYLTEYSDKFDSGWNDIKYVGRAEKFYIFNEFKRDISLGFNIPCFNRKELTDKHKRLNTLVSILAGEYKGGLLGGIITKLTVGNYINDQPGIINNLSFQPIDNSSWDLKAKLAFYIKVSFGFTLIHNGLPQYGYDFITVEEVPDAVNDDGNTGQALPKSGDVVIDPIIAYPEVTFGRQTPASIGF